jgi:hypothetical protein
VNGAELIVEAPPFPEESPEELPQTPRAEQVELATFGPETWTSSQPLVKKRPMNKKIVLIKFFEDKLNMLPLTASYSPSLMKNHVAILIKMLKNALFLTNHKNTP